MDCPWPRDKENLFEDVKELKPLPDRMVFLSRDEYLPYVYKESADIIIDQIETGKIRGDAGMLIPPIAYLYRHSFELIMKKIISQGLALGILEQNVKLEKIMGGHQLYPLWNKVRKVLNTIWPDIDKKILTNVERVIQQFHKVDKTGQKFRYACDKNNNPSVKHSIIADFSSTKKCCNKLFQFFQVCEMGLSNALSNLDNTENGYC